MSLFGLFSKKKDINKDEEPIREPTEIDFSEFDKVTEYIYNESGITDLNSRALTASRLQTYAKENGVYSTLEFLLALEKKSSFYQEVMNIATINESFFLREIKELKWLVNYIKESNKKIDILVLPCATGEEVYSILILLLESGVRLDRITIKGYDLNSQAILSAQKGLYDEHSLHNVDSNLRRKYFKRVEDELYEIIDELKLKPTFVQANIFEIDTQKEHYDIVLSRNMFIYFDDKNRKKALDVIVSLLRQDGLYIKGHADYIEPHPYLKNIAYGIYSKQI